MFIGHYAPAFIAATSRKAPRLGILFVAAQLVDFGFFSLMLADVEHMRLTPGITAMNAMDLYDMPWTHSLAGALGWALGFAVVVRLLAKSWAAGAVAGAVVVSHWLIDLLVHRPDLTLAGSPPAYGLGLWNHPAIEIPLELAFAYGGLAWFVTRTRARSRSGLVSPAVLALAMAGCQAFNWFVPPEAITPAVPVSALAAYALLALLAWWTAANRDLRT
ncbi:MAG: hypothetical protein V4574_15120 [Pseudomonadota bacterium]